MSEYYTTIGKGSFNVPDISDTNYMKTEADMVKSVNSEIDRVQDSYDAYFDGLINSYNHEFEKPTFLEQSISAINSVNKFIKEDKKDIDKWLEFQKKYKAFYDLRFDEDRLKAVDPNWTLKDNDVLKYSKVTHLMDEQQRQNYAAAKIALKNKDFDEARRLFNGLGDIFKDNIDDDRTAIQLSEQHETIFRPKAEAGMKIWLGDDNGFPEYNKYVTYNDVITNERARLYVDRTIDAYFAFRHEDLFRGRIGKFKSEFVRTLIERTDLRTTKAAKAQASALVDIEKQSRARDITQRLKIDKGYIVKAINIYSGQFIDEDENRGDYDLSNLDETQRYGVTQSRDEVFRVLTDAVKDDPSMIPHVLEALDHEFIAYDGTKTTPKKYWKKQSQTLIAACKKAQADDAQARLDEKEVEDQARVDTIVQQADARKVPMTAAERSNIITSYMRDAGITDPQQVPAQLKDIAYGGMELDEDIDFRLTTRAARGEEIVAADLGGISDPIMRDKWKKHIAEEAGFNLPTEQHQQATEAIKAVIAERLREDITTVKGNPLYVSNFEGGFQSYLGEYRRIKRAQPSITTQEAHNAALAKATADITTPVGDNTGDYLFDKRPTGYNIELKNDVQETRRQIGGQPASILLSETPLNGEEKHLQAAAKYIAYANQGIASPLPRYYKMLAQSKGIPWKFKNPEQLMRARLQAAGLLKGESEVTIPEFKNLPEEKAIELTVKPTACKTYMQMQNMTSKEEDVNWMLDITKDPTAMNEGGYDYVVGPNVDGGKDAHLDKPLTQHTVGEVVELARSGHSGFGAYGITAEGLISIVEANQVPLDVPFNQNTQDLFVLGRLRQKAQQAQSLSTQQSAYRRLVNIRPEDNEKFLEIVGDLPPFLQLSNMIPICSTELVNQTLQR